MIVKCKYKLSGVSLNNLLVTGLLDSDHKLLTKWSLQSDDLISQVWSACMHRIMYINKRTSCQRVATTFMPAIKMSCLLYKMSFLLHKISCLLYKMSCLLNIQSLSVWGKCTQNSISEVTARLDHWQKQMTIGLEGQCTK